MTGSDSVSGSDGTDGGTGAATGGSSTGGTGDTAPSTCTDRWLDGSLQLEVPQLLEEVSSPALETDPHLDPTGLMLYFSSNRPGGQGGLDIYVARRDHADAPFAAPTPVLGLNGPEDDAGLALVDSGRRAYFTTDRDMPDGTSEIWEAELVTGTDDLIPVGAMAEINTAHQDYDPFPSPDGLRLYWTVAGDGVEPTNLRVATRDSIDDPFGTGDPIGLDSDAYEDSPSLTGDQRVIVFGSDRPGGPGQHDLWYAVRDSPGAPFDAPEPVPDINSPGRDGESFVTPDGCTVLFSSERADGVGQWDLYAARVVED